MTTEKGRTRRFNVRLSDDLANRLDEWAEQMGLAPSTLAAVAIAEYLNTKDMQRKNMRTQNALISKQMSGAFEELLKDPKAFSALMSAADLAGEK